MAADEKETRRDMLAKAWDEAEKDDETPLEEHKHEEAKVVEPEKVVEEPKLEAKPKPEDPDKKEARAATELGKKPAAGAAAPVVTDKAPNAWKTSTREHWAKLPEEVRSEINRRELEVQQTLTQTGQVRKFAQDFAQTIQPYSHLIRAQGSTPLQAVNNLMQTAAGLMQGNPEQKARIVSDIIANYGVDIQTLDTVLTSMAGQRPQNPQQAVPDWARPMFGFMENVQKMQEQRQHQLVQEADQAIAAMEQKPFFSDLKEDIADLMETAANRGKVLTMEQAYERALALNPEIAKIINQRKLAETNRNPVSEAAATLARARKASSTVKGAPGGTKVGVPNGKMTRRQMLSEAWDDSSS